MAFRGLGFGFSNEDRIPTLTSLLIHNGRTNTRKPVEMMAFNSMLPVALWYEKILKALLLGHEAALIKGKIHDISVAE